MNTNRILRCKGIAAIVPAGFIILLTLAAGPVDAQTGNILTNADFGANSGENVPTGWTYFEDPTVPNYAHDYWIGGPPKNGFYAPPVSGSAYWRQWGAG